LASRAQRLEEAGKAQGAESLYRAALAKETNQPLALLGLARRTGTTWRRMMHRPLLTRIPNTVPEHPAAQQLLAANCDLSKLVRVQVNEQKYRDRLAADQNDLDARFELSQVLAAVGRFEEALTRATDRL
jgi:thioredoxin-like negative regulator of GroEL